MMASCVKRSCSVCPSWVIWQSRVRALRAARAKRRKRPTPPVEPKITGEVKAQLIALACLTPPAGHARWSLRLLHAEQHTCQ